MITRSFGGILFIDEAYGLYKEDSRDYGSEVIEMLVKFIDMTENKDFVLVLAGYRNLMTRMLNANLNLMSRMGNWIGNYDTNICKLVYGNYHSFICLIDHVSLIDWGVICNIILKYQILE
jgi:hypothetical protein